MQRDSPLEKQQPKRRQTNNLTVTTTTRVLDPASPATTLTQKPLPSEVTTAEPTKLDKKTWKLTVVKVRKTLKPFTGMSADYNEWQQKVTDVVKKVEQ